jgi:hypothetical protein
MQNVIGDDLSNANGLFLACFKGIGETCKETSDETVLKHTWKHTVGRKRLSLGNYHNGAFT